MNCWRQSYILSLWTEEKGGSAGRGLYRERSKELMVVNGGVTIILFVVTNPVCVPKKRNLSIFRGLKGAWKHIRTLEWKWKRDGTPVPSEMVRSLAQKKGLIRIILTWFCFLYYFNNTGSGSSPTRIE
ncbi:hypothetical protein QVD17_42449 [Tagetes erecta]|nr:hypothetical protein QVD17_42449 [Tagetes erecta]